MEAFLAALEASGPAQWLRVSRWGYAAANTAHVMGLATLYGAILALDLRLLGLWRGARLNALLAVLPRVAATGLALALATGVLLFAIRAGEYAALGVFRLKMALVALGTAAALLTALRGGLAGASPRRMRAMGGLSLVAWTGALVSGRMIAFAGD